MNKPMKNPKDTLAQLMKQLAVDRFLRWWFDELLSMVPQRMRQTGLEVGDLALVTLDRHEVALSRSENGRAREIARIPLATLDPVAQRMAFMAALDKVRAGLRDVALALPNDRILRKTLILPLATEENLRQVLEFQMEQHTPFSVEQVYFGYRVKTRDFERKQLTVEFVATPRSAVDEAVKTLAGWDAQVRVVAAEDMLGKGELLNLLPVVQGKVTLPLLQGIKPWLAGLVLLLAMAALVMPVVIKREAVLQMAPWVEKGKRAAEAADNMRHELEARVDEHNYLLEKKQALPPVISVLEELTRVLPDDTWVQQLDIKGSELQIQGETASSSQLIGLFEQSGVIHGASYRSPLTKGQGAGTERYHLALAIRPNPVQQGAPTVPTPPAPPVVTPVKSAPEPAVAKDEGAAPVQPGQPAVAAEKNKQPAPALEKKP